MTPRRGRASCPRGYVTQILEEGKSRIVRLLLGDCLVGSDLAVADENDAVRVLCNVMFVVTRIIVFSCWCRFAKSALIFSPVFESRFPVGSSASTIDGEFTSA